MILLSKVHILRNHVFVTNTGARLTQPHLSH